MAVISIDALSKFYGSARGVVDLSLEVDAGEVFGFLGPNGAGKTTTIRTLLDLIRPTSGRAQVFGLDSHRDSVEIRKRVGYVPGEIKMYDRMTGLDFLRHLAALRGGVDWAHAMDLADRLDCDLDKMIKSLSHGNRQKVALIQAFMHRPDLVILDEPTQGLDPFAQQEFQRVIDDIRDEGQTVFLCSHVMPEVERLCHRVAIIREGRLAAVEEIADLKARSVRNVEIHFASPIPSDAFANLPGVHDVSAAGGIVRLAVAGSVDAVIKVAARHEVVDIFSHEPTLEEIFLAFYGDREGEPDGS
ncbi:MAG: ABC transporter ATP-binding protein [Actinomycetota bacterium]